MNLKDIFNKDNIHLSLQSKTKLNIIKELANLFPNDAVSSYEKIYHDAILREEEITTGIGNGVAIPHAKSDAAIKPSLVFGRALNEIDFNALDDKPVSLFFMIVIPKSEPNLHLEILSLISKILMDEEKLKILRTSNDINEIYQIITS